MSDRTPALRSLQGLLARRDDLAEWAPADRLEAILIQSPGQPTREERGRLLASYRRRGYAWFELGVEPEAAARGIVDLAAALALGQAFVPPLYHAPGTAALYDDLGVNVLAAAEPSRQPACHPTFESRTSLELHTDGTLQALGEIPTTTLFCQTPARCGGESTIFHSVNAFLRLAAGFPELASCLLDDRALVRHATVNGSRASCPGPVFMLRNGEVLSRYSTTPRDQWAFDEVSGLREAYAALEELVRPPYLTQIRLAAGQGLLLANDKVAHGRTAFEDGDEPRRMLRALFRRRPSGSR
jgi:TfdA family taurine catabolism dioxygenase TauD